MQKHKKIHKTNFEEDWIMTKEKKTKIGNMVSLPTTILTLFNITASIMLIIKMTAFFGLLFGIGCYVVMQIVMSVLMIYKNKDLVIESAGKMPDEMLARKIIELELPAETLIKTILLAMLFYGSRII